MSLAAMHQVAKETGPLCSAAGSGEKATAKGPANHHRCRARGRVARAPVEHLDRMEPAGEARVMENEYMDC